MTEQEVERMSNVDLLKEYGIAFRVWPQQPRDRHIMRNEILRRMDAGTRSREDIKPEESEHQR